MTAEQARRGTWVKVMDHHRVAERRGLVGKVVARYGGEKYLAVDVRLADGQYRLFWPSDLEEISSPPRARWRLLLGRDQTREVPSVPLTLNLCDDHLVLRGYFNRGGVFIEKASSTQSKGQHQAITEYLSGFRAAKELATNQETFLAMIKRIR